MAPADTDHQLHQIWEDLKAVAPTTSKRFRDFLNFRDVARAMPEGGTIELIDPNDTFKQSNIRILGPDGEPASPAPEGVMPGVTPEPETITPEVTPEPETVTPEVSPEPDTLTPEVAPEPETVTPEVPLAPDQSVPTIGGATDQGLIDVNPVEPKLSGKRRRARDADGKFLGDDPTTATNEAWVTE